MVDAEENRRVSAGSVTKAAVRGRTSGALLPAALLGLADVVRFLGPLPPERLREPLSAADVFVLATRNEGWANAFLEAMACGLPVVTTDVGGNAEVVCQPELGIVVPFGNTERLFEALRQALVCRWDSAKVVAYARTNTWDRRVAVLVDRFRAIHNRVATSRVDGEPSALH